MPFLTMLIQLLLTNPADVPLIAIGRNYRMSGGIIVRLIQTQVLRRLRSGLWTFHHDGLDGGCQKLGVMDIGSG
jgi:hypothetical protein